MFKMFGVRLFSDMKVADFNIFFYGETLVIKLLSPSFDELLIIEGLLSLA